MRPPAVIQLTLLTRISFKQCRLGARKNRQTDLMRAVSHPGPAMFAVLEKLEWVQNAVLSFTLITAPKSS